MNRKQVLENEIGKYFFIKPKSVGPPKLYLGNKVSKVTLDNGVEAWSFSSLQYVQNDISNVEEYLKKKGKSLPKRATHPYLQTTALKWTYLLNRPQLMYHMTNL